MFEEFGIEHLLLISQGALLTVVLCTVTGVVGSLLGVLLGLAVTSRNRAARAIGSVYISMVRGMPLLVIIFFIYFGLPLLVPGADLSKTLAAGVALSLYAAAYMGEIVRGGIDSIPVGQSEAAEALGLGYVARMQQVILPQAMKAIIPPGIGFLIALVKDSSLVSVIGFVELTKAGRVVSSLTADPLLTFLVVAAFYFVICFAMSQLSQRYERKLSGQLPASTKSKLAELNLKVGSI